MNVGFTPLPPLAQGGWLSQAGWWALLAASLGLAAGHLVSMLSTRWGDRGAGPKSLIFSLLTHAALISAVFASKPELDRLFGEPAESPAEPDRRFQVGVVDPDAADVPAPDRDPLPWRDPNAPSDRPVERTDLDRLESDVPPDPAVARVRPELAAAPSLTADRPLPDAADAAPEPAVAERDPAAAPAPVAAPAPDPGDVAAAAVPAAPALARRAFVEESEAPANPRVTRVRPEGPSALSAPSLTDRRPLPDEAPRAAPAPPAPALAAADPGPAPAVGFPEGVPAGPQPAEPAPRRRDLLPEDELPGRPRVARDRPEGSPRPSLRSLTDRRGLPDAAFGSPAGPEAVASARSDAVPPAPGVPDAYRLRDLTRRTQIARQYGGTAESEQAVELALAYFARRQSPDGRWDGSAHGAGRSDTDQTLADVDGDRDKLQTGRKADTGLTGLVTLSFLGAGYTRTAGRYAPAVDKAVRYLLSEQAENGDLGGSANYYARMYCHGIAAYALAEALALEGDDPDPELKRGVEKAVAFIAEQQYPDGGWRYSQRVRFGDMSMFGWQCLALKSADNAGVPMPGDARANMIRFLRSRSETAGENGRVKLKPDGGLARYILVFDRFDDPAPDQPKPITPTMTAEALFCKQMLGLYRDNPASVEAVAYLDGHPPELRRWDLYYWYYATLALFQHGGPEWEAWNGALREILVAEQIARGPDAGSWPVRSAPGQNYTAFGGRLYSTALATLCLEVYYRFTPAAGGAAAMDGRGK